MKKLLLFLFVVWSLSGYSQNDSIVVKAKFKAVEDNGYAGCGRARFDVSIKFISVNDFETAKAGDTITLNVICPRETLGNMKKGDIGTFKLWYNKTSSMDYQTVGYYIMNDWGELFRD